MDIDLALSRFESVMRSAWPSVFAKLQPGLPDEGIQRLRDAIAPYLLPSQVELLYRWRNGGDQGVFGGWRMLPVDELIDRYRSEGEQLESPRTWLPVFDDQIVNVVTLDLPAATPSSPAVWFGHTHDGFLCRMFDSVGALLHVVADAAEARALNESRGSLGMARGEFIESLDGASWDLYRLARCPGSFRSSDPPPGTELSRFASPDWPTEWLLPLGVTEEALRLRGITHTVAQLVAEAASHPVRGTVRGRVVTGIGGGGWWNPVVSDGTGQIVVSCRTALTPLSVWVGQEGEFDVLLESADSPEPPEDDDPQVQAIAQRFRAPLPTALALGVRPVQS